jgi:hypothetical protein
MDLLRMENYVTVGHPWNVLRRMTHVVMQPVANSLMVQSVAAQLHAAQMTASLQVIVHHVVKK